MSGKSDVTQMMLRDIDAAEKKIKNQLKQLLIYINFFLFIDGLLEIIIY